MQSDSVDKIVTRYFAAVTKVSFTYKGKTYEPKVLKVSPLLLRDYTCPPMCGGCCFKFTLDYLPSEFHPPGIVHRQVEFNGRQIDICTDPQEDNESDRCRHLRRKDGRCGIYERRPFTCDFELIRTLHSEDPKRPDVLTQKLFGRGWSYARVDGGKGALCEMTKVTNKSTDEVIRKLERLQQWTKHFGLKFNDTWIPDILGHIWRGTFNKGIPVEFVPDNVVKKVGFGL